MEAVDKDDYDRRIAVVGLSGRFPGARDIDEFWDCLQEGRTGISFFDRAQVLANGARAKDVDQPGYVLAGADVPDIDLFDAAFFGYTPGNARLLDPQHRLFLESCWHALEDATCDPARFDGAIGVFAGQRSSDYFMLMLAAQDPRLVETYGGNFIYINTDKDYIATRVAYALGLTGPALTIQTACSTSLVAVHVACQSLLSGECDLALAGGASLRVPQGVGYLSQEGVAARDGHCRAFDADADGCVQSGGVGVVTLKPLAFAVRDGDPIRAVICGSAVNNDGALKLSFAAPSVNGQAAVVEEALTVAGVSSASIGYVETHGTGTPLGDPIEIAALTKAFNNTRRQYCAVGSLKANIGHSDAASGIAGLIKTVLSVQYGTIVPTPNFRKPNPEINFDNSPFYVADRLSAWPESQTPRRAGVSSFGIGGTNVHLVIEQATQQPTGTCTDETELLVFSAKSAEALTARRHDLGRFLTENPEAQIGDVAHTLRYGRAELPYRSFVVATDRAAAVAELSTVDTGAVAAPETPPEVVWLFSGIGTQRPGMVTGLYQRGGTFRDGMDHCLALIAELTAPEQADQIRSFICGEVKPAEGAEANQGDPLLAPVSLFVVGYSLARMWMDLGVVPSALIGHSTGEYVAACVAGVFGPRDVLQILLFRGERMRKLPSGAMLAVPLSEAEVARRLPGNDGVVVATVNEAQSVVVSGATEAVHRFDADLRADGVESRLLNIDTAGHSPGLDPMLGEFRTLIDGISLRPPEIPLVSNVTGDWVRNGEVAKADYWATHLRQTVRFRDGIRTLLDGGKRLFLEIGPGRTLCSLVRRNAEGDSGLVTLPSLPHPGEQTAELEVLLGSLGALWSAGIPVRWDRFWSESEARKIRLPGYAFDRQRYWIGPTPDQGASVVEPAETSAGSPDAEAVRAELQEIMAKLLGVEPAAVAPDRSFLELGADSLILMRASKEVQKRLGVKIAFRMLLVKWPTVSKLAGWLIEQGARLSQSNAAQSLEVESATMGGSGPVVGQAADAAAVRSRTVQPIVAGNQELYGLLRDQLDVLRRQLDILAGASNRDTGDAGSV